MLELDLTGLVCPMPVLKTQAFLKKRDVDQLKLICTDPQTESDIPIFCQAKGIKLIKWFKENEKYIFIISCKN